MAYSNVGPSRRLCDLQGGRAGLRPTPRANPLRQKERLVHDRVFPSNEPRFSHVLPGETAETGAHVVTAPHIRIAAEETNEVTVAPRGDRLLTHDRLYLQFRLVSKEHGGIPPVVSPVNGRAIALNIHTGAAGEQHLGDREITRTDRRDKRLLSTHVHASRVRAIVEKKRRDLPLPHPDRSEESGLPIGVPRVDKSALCQKETDRADGTAFHREHQRCGITRYVRIGATRQEKTDDIVSVSHHGQNDRVTARRSSVPGDRVRIHPFIQKSPHALQVAVGQTGEETRPTRRRVRVTNKHRE